MSRRRIIVCLTLLLTVAFLLYIVSSMLLLNYSKTYDREKRKPNTQTYNRLINNKNIPCSSLNSMSNIPSFIFSFFISPPPDRRLFSKYICTVNAFVDGDTPRTWRMISDSLSASSGGHSISDRNVSTSILKFSF